MNLTTMLFSVWLLSLPFYHFSIVGSMSVDNILGPILFIFVLLRILMGAHSLSIQQLNNIAMTSVAILIYLTTHIFDLLLTKHVVWNSLYGIAKNMLYFMLPIISITTERDLKRASVMMIGIMVLGSLTAFMSTMGLISFDFARQAESRLELINLPKSVGLFTSYGDMALLMSLALLLAIGGRTFKLFSLKAGILTVIVVFTAALLGILAMQSRNLVLTLAIAFVAYYAIGRWRKYGTSWSVKLYLSLIVGMAVSVFTVLQFSVPLIEWLEGLGGTSEAAATVKARLHQYQDGWALVENRILLGADPYTYEKNEVQISLIHNMWLKELVQSGLLGILAIALFYYRAMKNQKDRLNADRNSIARVYITLLVCSLVATQFYPGDSPVFWIVIGLATAMPKSQFEKKLSLEGANPASTFGKAMIPDRCRTP